MRKPCPEKHNLGGKVKDREAILQVAHDYIEGWYRGDADRMDRALFTRLAKRRITPDGEVWEVTKDWMVGATGDGKGKIEHPEKGKKEVTILDMTGVMASVKIVSEEFIDYVHLVKHAGKWVIVNVLWDYTDQAEILEKLSDGDLRSEGRAEEVAQEIIANPHLLNELTRGLRSENKVIRGRVCMTMEIISRQHPQLLADVLPQVIELAAIDAVPQVRWHIAEILGNVEISDDDIEKIVRILLEYLEDKSKIVKYCSVQTLGILGGKSALKDEIIARIGEQKNVSKSLSKIVTQALEELGSS
jgi:hypothetical protein